MQNLEITTPIVDLDYLPWPGIGRNIWEAVTFSNDVYDYEVFTGFERGPDEGADGISPVYGGVVITRGALEIASLGCDEGMVKWGYGGGLYDAKAEAGQCWNSHPDNNWTSCSNK